MRRTDGVLRGGPSLARRLRQADARIARAGPAAWGPLAVMIAMVTLIACAVGIETAGWRQPVTPDEVVRVDSAAVLPPNAAVVALDAAPRPDRPTLEDGQGIGSEAPQAVEELPTEPRQVPPSEPEAGGEPEEVEPAAEAQAAGDPEASPDLLRPFRGLSTWIDVYDTGWTPAQQIEIAVAGGVEVLFLQSGKYDSPADVHHDERFAETIERAHDASLQVVVWYVPDFVDPDRDLRRSLAAIDYVTPRGDRPDAFGLDIEVEDEADIQLRSERLLTLSRTLRERVGDDYPMAAIVLPPQQLDLRPGWWPAFPFAELAPLYDVAVPMSYSSFRGTDAETTYRWNLASIVELRSRAATPDWPVHLAGGIADDLPEIGALVEAARDGGTIGAGLYDLHTTPPDAWPALGPLRQEPSA